MAVNNETGAVFPVREVADIIKKKRSPALLHTDAVQAFLKVPFSPRSFGADLISISAHKIHGPKGVGALYIKEGLKLPSLLFRRADRKARAAPERRSFHALAGFGQRAKAGAESFGQSCAHVRAVYNYVNTPFWLPFPKQL